MKKNTLQTILERKRKEVEERKSLYPVKLLEQSSYFAIKPVSLVSYLLSPNQSGIIAEIKRKSPSRGLINPDISVERVSVGYVQAGASGLSVLTDEFFFGGSLDDLRVARSCNLCPILRKDFIIDEYQIVEAKSVGADVILLISAALSPVAVSLLARLARSFGMEVLLEVHDAEELNSTLSDCIHLVGVNNRDLKTMEVNVETSKRLAGLIPPEFIRVSESGLSSPQTVKDLRGYGFQGFLIGDFFMRHVQPERAAQEFIESLQCPL